jgi:hypothetical protein
MISDTSEVESSQHQSTTCADPSMILVRKWSKSDRWESNELTAGSKLFGFGIGMAAESAESVESILRVATAAILILARQGPSFAQP